MPKDKVTNIKGGLGQFKSKISSHEGLVAVHFWADWAQQCGPMDEAINILSDDKQLKSVLFLRVEAEEEADVSMEYEVAAVPTFLFFANGKVIERVEGAKVADVTKKVRELSSRVNLMAKLPSSNAKPVQTTVGAGDLNSRLKMLINSSPCMLFMKGSPGAPECGFSRQTIDLLKKFKADYGYFDILRDNEVRQGLKEYSKWPTFPQLYINGELIGGLDILRELDESGELKTMLPKKQSLEDKLKRLINQSGVVVFMKGSPDEPKCGFSRQLIGILSEIDVPFTTFDILKDDEVRQGLKTFSNWPTYPQVYVKGELIGGLDIIEELNDSGELVSTLKAV